MTDRRWRLVAAVTAVLIASGIVLAPEVRLAPTPDVDRQSPTNASEYLVEARVCATQGSCTTFDIDILVHRSSTTSGGGSAHGRDADPMVAQRWQLFDVLLRLARWFILPCCVGT